jgi:hypothetical protein
MNERPSDAIPVAVRVPDARSAGGRNYVLAWVDDPSVAIHDMPVLAWHQDGKWWTGLPGRYTDLEDHRWAVTHWQPIAALSLDGKHTQDKRHG